MMDGRVVIRGCFSARRLKLKVIKEFSEELGIKRETSRKRSEIAQRQKLTITPEEITVLSLRKG